MMNGKENEKTTVAIRVNDSNSGDKEASKPGSRMSRT
jgi:hypothetical protein